MAGQSQEDFSAVPSVTGSDAVTVDGEVLREAVARVTVAAADEKSRPVLEGVCVDIEDGTARLAAADGFQLVVTSMPVTGGMGEDNRLLIPANALKDFAGTVHDDDSVTMAATRNCAVFRNGDLTMTTQLIAGTYPDYERLIPTEPATRVSLDAAELQAALRQVSLMAQGANRVVRIETHQSEGRLRIYSQSDTDGDSEASCNAVIEGDDNRIGLDIRYITDIVNTLDGKLCLYVVTPSSALRVGIESDPEYTGLIMPMFVQWQEG